MEGTYLNGWEAFEQHLKVLRSEYGERQLLFRGVCDSVLPLTTTLERAGCEDMSFKDYFHLLSYKIKPAVETFTETEWDFPEMDNPVLRKANEIFHDRELLSFHKFPSQGLYRYMVYLRHHGFPSPLLDWSSSPYVAAFFAFRNQGVAKNRSIYVYCEMPKGHKGGAVGGPTIRRIGPYIRSHPRHFRQQSDYTICGSMDSDVGWRFRTHESVFNTRPEQDAVWKCDIPSTERGLVLKMLNDHNLNAYSIFNSEESLLETLWFREYESK